MGTLGEPFVEMAASLRPTYETLLDVRTRLQSMARQPHSVADLEPIQVRRFQEFRFVVSQIQAIIF